MIKHAGRWRIHGQLEHASIADPAAKPAACPYPPTLSTERNEGGQMKGKLGKKGERRGEEN